MSPDTASVRHGSEVSVALCTHNGERFIAEQLESIFGQTVPPDEIVISDDASEDHTVEIARATVQALSLSIPKPPTLVVLTNDRPLGVTANFEQAIAACSGGIIVLSDQDDRWREDRIERALDAFDTRAELLLLHGDALLVSDSGSSLGSTLFEALEVRHSDIAAIHDGRAFELLLRRNLVTGATAAFRAELVEVARPFPVAWVHDEWLAIVASAVGVLDVVEVPLVDYRQHGANQIGVARLALGGKLGRVLAPGAQRNERLLARATALVDRFVSMGDSIDPDKLARVERKLIHEQVRSALPSNRLSRVPAVLRELGTGRYRQFGRGIPDAVRDLIQPHHASR